MADNKRSGLCIESQFDKFYREHAASLFRFLYYKCGDREEAGDLTQDAFIAVWNNCHKVEIEKARSYLFTVANNRFLNTVSKKKIVLQFQSQQTARSDSQNPHFLLEEKEFNDLLQKAINDLTDKQREVFLLSRIEGLKYREIAEMLDISVKAVEKRMHSALKQLKDLIQKKRE